MNDNSISRRSLLAMGGLTTIGLMTSPTLAFADTKAPAENEEIVILPKITGELLDQNGQVIASTHTNFSNKSIDANRNLYLMESGSSLINNGDGSFTATGSIDLIVMSKGSIEPLSEDNDMVENGAARATVYVTYYLKDMVGPMGYIKISQARGEIVKLSSMATLGTRTLAVAQGDSSLGLSRGDVFSGNSHTINTGWDYTQYFAPPFCVNGAECTVDTVISGMSESFLRAQLLL